MPTTPAIENKKAEDAFDLKAYKEKCKELFAGLKLDFDIKNPAYVSGFLRELANATTIDKAEEVTKRYAKQMNLKGSGMFESAQELALSNSLQSAENKLRATNNVKDKTTLNPSNPIPAVTPFPAVNTAINVVNDILDKNKPASAPIADDDGDGIPNRDDMVNGTFETDANRIMNNNSKKLQFLALANGSGMSNETVNAVVNAIMTDGDSGLSAQQLFDAYKPKQSTPKQNAGGTPTYMGNGNGGSSNIDNRTEEQKAKDLANLGAAYKDAETKAAGGDPSKLRELDAFFQVTRPEEQYSAEYNQLKTVRLVSGDGPSLPGDTLQGNGSAVYAVNERGERFHVTQEMAVKMRANGTWKEPENLSQAEVDGMKMRFALTDTSQIGAINKPAINGFMLISGDSVTSMGPEALTGNGSAVFAVNDKGERFHVTPAMAQEMRANNTWQQPVELSQASVDKMAFKGSFNSLTDFNSGTVTERALDITSPVATQTKPASGIGVQPPSIDPVPPQRGTTDEGSLRSADFRDSNSNGIDDRDETTGGVRAGFIDEPRKPIAATPATPTTPSSTSNHIRNDKDSGFAYPWSAAKATGTTDVQGTIGKAVEFMNKHEGKNYKYDSIKGTIQAEDGSFISKNDVQSLNNIITKYHKTNFELPESAGAGITAQTVNLTYGGVGTAQKPALNDVAQGAVRIDSGSTINGLDGGFAAGSTAVKTHPVEGGFNLP